MHWLRRRAPGEPMEAIELSIASRLENVYLVGLSLRGICQGLPLTKNDVDALELAVCEAANNAIKHAYGSRPDNLVRISISVDGTGLVICVADTGKPIGDRNMLARELPLAQTVDALPEGGMGLFLIRNAADSLGYKSGDDENVLIIRKAFTQKL